MNKEEILKEYKKQEDKILISQILDKKELSRKKEKIEYTDFLDMYQLSIANNILNKLEISNYIFFGGYEESERKILVFYPEKYNKNMIEKNYSKMLKIIKIKLSKEDEGKFVHRNYLGGVIKVGINREKVGDILVSDDGADIIVKSETAEILAKELSNLTRFEKSKLEVSEISNLRKKEIKVENIDIIVPSLRLDNIVSDLARTSRSKAVQILNQERVFINGQNETKPSKNIKIEDIITIRGKGRFIIKEIKGTTRSGRTILTIEKYV